ncbi:unnamed protein product, partial [Ectocarpus sp. 4 AP-2014]
ANPAQVPLREGGDAAADRTCQEDASGESGGRKQGHSETDLQQDRVLDEAFRHGGVHAGRLPGPSELGVLDARGKVAHDGVVSLPREVRDLVQDVREQRFRSEHRGRGLPPVGHGDDPGCSPATGITTLVVGIVKADKQDTDVFVLRGSRLLMAWPHLDKAFDFLCGRPS